MSPVFRRRAARAVTALLLAGVAACGGGGQDVQAGAPGADAAPGEGAAASDGAPTSVARPPFEAPTAWAQASSDARRSSTTDAVGPQSATVRWKRTFPAAVTPGPAVGVDGSLLVAANDGVLRALNPKNGRTRWAYDGGSSYGIDLSTTPAVLGDGTILWPGPGSRLIALDRDGTKLWTEQFDSMVLSPAVVGGGRVYVTDMAGTVRALDVDADADTHRVAWTRTLDGTSYTSPAVGPDGTVYAAAGSTMVAFADLGDSAAVRWRFTAKDIIEVSAGVAADGTVIVGTNTDDEYGLNPDGSIRWRYPKRFYSYSSPVARDGLVYFGDHSGHVDVVDAATGEERARLLGLARDAVPGGVGPWTAPLVDARGDVYFGTEAGHVYGFAPDGARLFDLKTGETVASYPALTADGTLVIGDQGGTVYALRDDAS